MGIIFQLLITLFTFGCVLSFFYYVWFSLKYPQEYLQEKHKERRPHGRKPKIKLTKYMAYIGFLLVFYFGVKEGGLSFLPDEWGSLDEWGEFVSLKDAIALSLTPLSLFVLDPYDKAIISLAREADLKDEEDLWGKYQEQYAELLIRESNNGDNSKWLVIGCIKNKKIILQRFEKEAKEQASSKEDRNL